MSEVSYLGKKSPKSLYVFICYLKVSVLVHGGEWSGVFKVQCEASAVLDELGCFYEVQSKRSIYQEVSEHVTLSSAGEPYGDPDFFFLHLPQQSHR